MVSSDWKHGVLEFQQNNKLIQGCFVNLGDHSNWNFSARYKPHNSFEIIQDWPPWLGLSSVQSECEPGNKVWVRKKAHIQELAIGKKSTIFVQSIWNSVKMIIKWGNNFH